MRFLALLVLLLGSGAYAQENVRMYVGFPAGGTTDVIARAIAPKLGEILNITIVIENKAGASGILAADAVKEAGPGALLVSPDFPFTIVPHMQHFRENPRYSLTDFTPVAIAAMYHSGLIVKGDSSLRTVADYIAASAKDPQLGDYGTTGFGSMAHLLMQDLLLRIKEKGTTLLSKHVPHKGVAPTMLSVLGGHIPSAVLTLSEALPRMKEGSIRMLCIFASKRSSFAPEVPTCTEEGYTVAQDGWFGILVSSRTGANEVSRLNKAIRTVVTANKEWFKNNALESVDIESVEFERIVKDDYERLGRIVATLPKN